MGRVAFWFSFWPSETTDNSEADFTWYVRYLEILNSKHLNALIIVPKSFFNFDERRYNDLVLEHYS